MGLYTWGAGSGLANRRRWKVKREDDAFGWELVGEMRRGRGEWGRNSGRAGRWADGGEEAGRQVDALRIGDLFLY